MYRMVVEALRKGIQVMIHAIGDRANREVMDIYERAQEAVPAQDRGVGEPRLRIEHLQIVHPDDIPRLAGAGIIASMEPSHAITDLHFAPSRLGVDRLAGAYAWRDVIDSGVIIAGGSDAPWNEGIPGSSSMPRLREKTSRVPREKDGIRNRGFHARQPSRYSRSGERRPHSRRHQGHTGTRQAGRPDRVLEEHHRGPGRRDSRRGNRDDHRWGEIVYRRP